MKKIMTSKAGIPLILIALIMALVGAQSLQHVWAAAGTSGPGNVTAKASGTVTEGTFVKLLTAGRIATATASSDNIVGICRTTAASTKLTSYAPVGATTWVTSGQAIAVGDLLTTDPNGRAHVLDAEFPTEARAAAVALTAASAEGTDVQCVVINAPAHGLTRDPNSIAEATTLTATQSGYVYKVTTTAVITLPATAAGVSYTFINDGFDGAVQISLSPNASDKIMGMDNAGVDDKDWINTLATAKRGDMVTLIGDGSAGWYIAKQVGTWASE